MKNRLKAITDAVNGIKQGFRTETHLKIHTVCAVSVIGAALLFDTSMIEWTLLLLAMAMVFITELLNTAIEAICNKIHPDFDTDIGLIKDISAGAVLIAAVIAGIIGLIVFLPKILSIIP